jgi:ribosomal protein S27AE
MLTDEKKADLIRVLSERLEKYAKRSACPMCGHGHFTIADAYLSNTLQSDFKLVNLGGPSIPSLAIICTNCGFISQHSLGILGLLPAEVNRDKE